MADRHIAALTARDARLKRQSEAADLIEHARAALRAGQFAHCVAQCDRLLAADYAGLLDADTVERVRLLRRRAEFRVEWETLKQQLDEAAGPQQRVALLRKFLEKHAEWADASPSERQLLGAAPVNSARQRVARLDTRLRDLGPPYRIRLARRPPASPLSLACASG